jgi:integrase
LAVASSGRQAGEKIVKSPKSDAGTRDVAIPPHIVPALREHLASHAQHGACGLAFPGSNSQHLARLSRRFYPLGRSPVGQTLRHTGAVLAASTGATLAELMARMGHSTVGASLKYQHAASDRDAVIAGLLSELTTGTVTLIRQRA